MLSLFSRLLGGLWFSLHDSFSPISHIFFPVLFGQIPTNIYFCAVFSLKEGVQTYDLLYCISNKDLERETLPRR